MTFLNPLALFGLAAAAIPILIHLLNLRKLKTIDFSTVRFLQELQKSTMRRLRVRQWLLLVLRTLLVLFLVLAFARPALRGSFPDIVGGHATSTVLIILDDSPSMALRNNRGVLFDQAKELSEAIVQSAQGSDKIFFLRLSEAGRRAEEFAPSTPAGILTALRAMSPSFKTCSYQQALDIAGKLLMEHPTANREVYLIGDAQASQFLTPSTTGDSARSYDADARLFSVELEPLTRENLGVASLDMKNQILAPGKPVTIQTVLHNYGEQAVTNTVVSLYLDGTRVAQRSADLSPAGTSTLTFQAAPRRRGIVPGYIQLEDDALITDNQFHFALPVPERPDVVLAGRSSDDTRYPAIALTLRTDTSQSGQYNVTRTTTDRLSALDFRTMDVLVLSGIQSLPSGMAERIAQFVRSGGGLLVFPGPATDFQIFNSQLVPRLGIPPLKGGEQLNAPGTGAGVGAAGFISFAKVDWAHPLFLGMFEERTRPRTGPPELESPAIHFAVTLTPTSRSNTLIQMSDGRPFFVEYPAGEGRILLFAVESGTVWSDFPLKGLYAPLLHRSVAYLASARQVSTTATVGQPLEFTIRMGEAGSGAPHVLRSPSGTEERLMPVSTGASGMATFLSLPTEETGVYTLRPLSGDSSNQTQKGVQAVAVNLVPRESDLRPVSEDEWSLFWQKSGFDRERVRRIDAGAPLLSTIQESRYGVELWSLFLMLALACAAAEMLIGRENREVRATEERHARNA